MNTNWLQFEWVLHKWNLMDFREWMCYLPTLQLNTQLGIAEYSIYIQWCRFLLLCAWHSCWIVYNKTDLCQSCTSLVWQSCKCVWEPNIWEPVLGGSHSFDICHLWIATWKYKVQSAEYTNLGWHNCVE